MRVLCAAPHSCPGAARRVRAAERACASVAAAQQSAPAAAVAPFCRRAALAAALAAAVAAAAPPSHATGSPLSPARNTAVLEQLKALERRRAVESGDLGSRLAGALGQLQRCRRLSSDGRYDDARQLLRLGAFKTLRVDAAAARAALGDGAPAEALAGASLDALDDALRRAARREDTAAAAQQADDAAAALEVTLRALLEATQGRAAAAAATRPE